MIQLNAVSVRFDNFVALHPTSLSFHQGQFTVLLGASGAGKSTLLRCLNMMNEPHSGSIDILGIGSLRNRKALQAHRRQTGMIFQQHQLIARLSAFELMGSLRIMQYQDVSAILIVILAMVTLVDTFSSFLRRKFK
jgi:phosphonate transport system ATP-binding protein